MVNDRLRSGGARRWNARRWRYSAGRSADEQLTEVPARSDDEPRFLVVGLIGGKHWSAW